MFPSVSFYIHEEEQMWIKDLNNRSQELLRLTDLWDEESFHGTELLFLFYFYYPDSTYIMLRKASFDTAVYGYVVCFVYLRLYAWHPMTSHNPLSATRIITCVGPVTVTLSWTHKNKQTEWVDK